MRIAMVSHSYYPTDPRPRREAEALVEAGHQVDIVCIRNDGQSARDEVNGVGVYRVPIKHRRSHPLIYIFEYAVFFVLAGLYLLRLHLARRYDIIHIHNMPNFLVFITLFQRLGGARIVLDMHDPMPQIYQAHFNVSVDDWKIRLLMFEEKLSCKYVDRIIVVDEPMRELLAENGQDPDKILVVMNFPDPSIFSPDKIPAAAAAAKEARADVFTLIYTGLVSHRNGVDIAVEAVNLLKDEMPDLRLLVVGSGPHLPELNRMVDTNGLRDQVTFKPPVKLDDVPALLATADVGISAHRDNAFTKLMFSTKVAEYMSLGMPVITARTYTMDYYFDDSELFFFEPDDPQSLAEQIRLLRREPGLLTEKKLAATRRMSIFNWLKEKEKLVELVDDLTATRRS